MERIIDLDRKQNAYFSQTFHLKLQDFTFVLISAAGIFFPPCPALSTNEPEQKRIFPFYSFHLHHAIPDSDMGLDILGRAGLLLQLFSQGRHKDPQGSDVVLPAPSPDLLGDEGVGQDLAYIPAQQAQQLVLAGGQMELLSI